MITHTASELAQICGATLEGDGTIELVGPAALDEASGNQVSFARDRRFAPQLETTRAGAVILPHDVLLDRSDLALLRVEDPNRAFSKAIASFLPQEDTERGVIDEGAHVDPTAVVGADVSIGFGCSVGAGARLEDGCVLHPGCRIGPRVEIGAGTVCHPNVVVYAGCRIGPRSILHAGCVIGSDGFGFEPSPGGWEKVPQCGTVEIGADVEIGANCTIDRGRFGPTRVGDGCKLDNLVHLAHNVVLEEGCALAAQVGIAGSTTVRRGAILGGQVGVGGHLEIGPQARIGGQGGVHSSLPGGKDYWGTPVTEKAAAMRAQALLLRLPAMRDLLRDLTGRVKALESNTYGDES